MRTTLDLDEDLLQALLQQLPGSSKTDAIEQAVRSYVSDNAVQRLRSMSGSLEIEDISSELRRSDRKT